MTKFNSLQAVHYDLLIRLDQQPSDLDVKEIESFVEHVKTEAADVVDPLDRDQLRAILRFWASYIYDQKGIYPDTTLKDPDREMTQQYMEEDTRIKKPHIFGALGIIIIFVLLFFGISAIISRVATSSTLQLQEAQNVVEQNTQVAIAAHQTAVSQSWTATPTETPLPSNTPNPTTVPDTPTPSNTPTNTPIPVVGTKIELLNLTNADNVKPETTLMGYYAGLNPGTSIHILLQPVNQCGSGYILVENYFEVKESTNRWVIPVTFGQDVQLLQPEQYNIQVYYTENRTDTQWLVDNQEKFSSCFNAEDLPDGISPYKELVLNVNRGKYENRLIFASRNIDSFYYDIASTRLDGTDFRLLTETDEIDERDPHFCKGNQKIAFVDKTPGGSRTSDDKSSSIEQPGTAQSIWVMNTDGSNKKLLVAEEGVQYERPVWSPDCQYIAYNVYRPGENIIWEINMIDFGNLDKGSLRVAYGRYQNWMPTNHSLVFNRPFEDDKLPSFILINLDDCRISFEKNSHNCPMSSLEFYTDRGTPVQGLQPAVSPDGQQLAFTTHVMSSSDGKLYQYIRGFDLGTQGSIYDITSPNVLPTDWFPYWKFGSDPLEIYFQSWRREYTNIWMTGIDGARLVSIGPKDRININVSQGLMLLPSVGP